jgi:hypothetical protein
MPYLLSWEPEGVYKQFSGVVTGAELLQSVEEVASDMRFAHLRYEVSDYLAAEDTQFSEDALNDIRAIRIGSFQTNPRIKVAIVTLNADIQQRMCITIAARLTLHQTQLFSDIATANTWVMR